MRLRLIIIFMILYPVIVSAITKPFLINGRKIAISAVMDEEVASPEFVFEHFRELVRQGWASETWKKNKVFSRNSFFIWNIIANTWMSNYLKLNDQLVRFQTSETKSDIIIYFDKNYIQNYLAEWEGETLNFYIRLIEIAGEKEDYKEIITSNIQGLLREVLKFAKSDQRTDCHGLEDELVKQGQLNCLFCSDQSVFPFLFKTNIRQYKGYDLMTGANIARLLGLEFKPNYRINDFDEIVRGIQQGLGDIGFFVSSSFERAAKVILVPYFRLTQCVLLNRPVRQIFRNYYLKVLNDEKATIYVHSGTVYREFSRYYFPKAVLLDFTKPVAEQYEQIQVNVKNTGILTNELRAQPLLSRARMSKVRVNILYLDSDVICMVLNAKAVLLRQFITKYTEKQLTISYDELYRSFVGGGL